MKTLKHILLTSAFIAASIAPSAMGEVKKIGLAVPNLQADYFNQIKMGVEKYAAELGIEVITVDAKNDTATQVSQVQDLITQDIDAFIYVPAGAAAATVPTRLAKGAGIPVINVDRFPETEPGNTFIAGESKNSSYEVCKYIIEKAGGTGEMAIIHGQKGTTPEVDRYEGCKRAIDEYPDVKVVAQQWTEMWSPNEGFQVAQNMLQAHPNIKVIFAQADAMAMGAAKATDVAGLSEQVIIGGYDGDTSALEYLAKGEGPFIVTATQQTQAMGRLAVDSAVKAEAGEEIPEFQLTDAVITTSENAPKFVAEHP
ncbi:MAG: substrate-binding domain-containing protein [Alphaproteobacteria bacterium]